MNKEVVNVGRQEELDWAKSLAIVAMICVHVYEQLSIVDIEVVPTDAFRIILEFVAGPLTAPLFMFCMGVGIMYSNNSAPLQMVKRAFNLLRNGYLLSLIFQDHGSSIYLDFSLKPTMLQPFRCLDGFFILCLA